MADHIVIEGFESAGWAFVTPAFAVRPLFEAAGWAWGAPDFRASRLAPAADNALPDGHSRIVTGLTGVFSAGRVRYTRGTWGLMPDEWGVIDDAQLTDSASEFEKRDGHGNLFGAGVSGTVYRLTLSIRMPSDRPMPEKGTQFYFDVRGQRLKFTVWAGGVERWRKSGLRMVDVAARHYTDFPDAVPVDLDDIEVPQDFL